jgi:hypothetical protein
MEKQNSTVTTLLRSAFIVGPALLAASAISFALGITIIPPGITGYVEGVLGSFALMLFVPIYLHLGIRLSEKKKILGGMALVAGLAGAVTGYGMELLRVTEYSMRLHGAGDEIWTNWYANMGMEYIGVAIFGPLFPLTSIILGIGFLITRQLPSWISIMLILAGIGFPLAQAVGIDWALKFTYPLACVFWLIALSAVGTKYFDQPKIAGI